MQPAVARTQVALTRPSSSRCHQRPGVRVIVVVLERDRTVTDNAIAVARGVTELRRVEQARRKPWRCAATQPARVDRSCPTRLVRREAGIESEDALRGGTVDDLRLLVRKVVRQVGADHDQRLFATPQPLEHLRHRLGAGVADDQRHQGEAAEQRLQEGQLNLERMFALVRPVVANYLRQVIEARQRSDVERDLAQRCLEGIRLGRCKAVHRDTMRGTE